MKYSFIEVKGDEKYKVVDLVTGGEAMFTDKLEAYKQMAVIKNILGHNYRLEVK